MLVIYLLQSELTAMRGEASRWRLRANQLTERANRANPEELKRLQVERENLVKQVSGLREEVSKMKQDQDNLLKQQAVERDNLHKQLIAERDEMRKVKATLSERETELSRLRTEVSKLQGDLTQTQGQLKSLQEEVANKDKAYADLTNKEIQVRLID